MDIILLAVTVVSLIVAFVMSVTAARLARDEKKRSAARVAALSVAAGAADDSPRPIAMQEPVVKPVAKAPWSPPPSTPRPAPVAPVASLRTTVPLFERSEVPLNEARYVEPTISHASGFLGATVVEREEGGRQRSLALAAVVLFLVLSGGLVWLMSGPRGTTAVAVGPNAPLELVSLSHQRQNEKLAVSGLVRNPVAGTPVDKLSAVVFLFDRMGTFVTSSRANVDFLKLGAGDESPFVVSIDAPATVARYRVSFRTEDGVVPHIDRRGDAAAPVEGEQTVNVKLK